MTIPLIPLSDIRRFEPFPIMKYGISFFLHRQISSARAFLVLTSHYTSAFPPILKLVCLFIGSSRLISISSFVKIFKKSKLYFISRQILLFKEVCSFLSDNLKNYHQSTDFFSGSAS